MSRLSPSLQIQTLKNQVGEVDCVREQLQQMQDAFEVIGLQQTADAFETLIGRLAVACGKLAAVIKDLEAK